MAEDDAGQPGGGPTVEDNGNTASVGDDNGLSGWEIGAGILSLGILGLGLGWFRHTQTRKAMHEEVRNLVRNQYDQLLTETAEAKLKAEDPDKEFSADEIRAAKYGLTPYEINLATMGDENRRKVWDGIGQDMVDTKDAFARNVQNIWRVSGAITAIGAITLAITLTIGTGGLGLGLIIGLGIVGALGAGWASGKVAKSSVENSTDKFMSKCMDDPELRKGRTKEYEQSQEAKREALGDNVLHKGKGKKKEQVAGQEVEAVEESKKEQVAVEASQPSSTVVHPVKEKRAGKSKSVGVNFP